MLEIPSEKKAWVVAVDMGYGHQRTAYPLRSFAVGGKVINVNRYKGIPPRDRHIWQTTRFFYESVSRFRGVPFIGAKVFAILDSFQKIRGYYPVRDLSKPVFSEKNIFRFIQHGWGKDLIDRMKVVNPRLPFVTTFFTPAFMAEQNEYPGDIYCVICDADIARPWVTLDPTNSRIKYFAPCTWARDRLKLYGVRPENIFLTGYPLPPENIGGETMSILKQDLGYRLLNLDPSGKYRKLYSPLIKNYLGELPTVPNHPLTIMFSIGGAGAQKEIVIQIINSLKEKIERKQLRLIISVGTHYELQEYFKTHLKGVEMDGSVYILYGKTIEEYFQAFNHALRTTDILWTKPSELTFYTGLGIPLIIAPPLGSQEDFNKRFILHVGAGTEQDNPDYTHQWLYDLLYAGDFAEMAMQGFVEMKILGTYNIQKIIAGHRYAEIT
jgi:hypothetical protein